MKSFAITLYGQCCRFYVVGQQVVSDVSIIGSCCGICRPDLCFDYESNNTALLLRLFFAVLGSLFCFKYQT